MSFFDFCIQNSDPVLVSIIIENCNISGDGLDDFLFHFLKWLKDNLGYFNIERVDLLTYKKHINQLIDFYISNYCEV